HGDGENRFIESAAVTKKLQATLHLFDLIVGTEEEFHIAGGTTDTIDALRAVRTVSDAVLVCKRGPMGASAFTGEIPDTLDEGLSGQGFPIEVFNVLGAGDGFMSGLLKGWLDGEDWSTALKYANACGAFAVSRHGCAPAYPSGSELQFCLSRGIKSPALRLDDELEQRHWSTARKGAWPIMRVFAFDHRKQLEDLAEAAGASRDKIAAFKQLCLEAVLQVAGGNEGYGLLCDGRLGTEALFRAAGQGLWIGRPVEEPGSRPLRLEIGPDFGSDLAEWPSEHVVKVLCFYHPDDDDAMKRQQEETVLRVADAARRNNLEFLLEVIPSKVGPVDDKITASIIQRFYDLGVYPDWWKLEPMTSQAAWANACAAIVRNDPLTRGVVVLRLDAEVHALDASFRPAARVPLVNGFAVRRAIFQAAGSKWLAGNIDDAAAVAEMAGVYADLCARWDQALAAADREAA